MLLTLPLTGEVGRGPADYKEDDPYAWGFQVL